MTDKTDLAAREIVEVVPMVMRTLALEMRSTRYLSAPVHCGLLVALSKHPHNLTELAERHAVSLPTMSSSISTLEERGWVTRTRAEDDRRVVLVELSPEGHAVLEDLTGSVAARVSDLLSGLSPSQCDQIVESLELLRECFARTSSSERVLG
jgi:DNA-binding MarR family transcriptional regulator